jgi:uncharacterized CHY-type Zn-finger protein
MPRQTTGSGTDDRFAVPLRGVAVDSETRCEHWDSPVDVVALRFGCCETYYPCFECHAALSDHEADVWPRSRFDDPAVLCGVCRETLTARTYLEGGDNCVKPRSIPAVVGIDSYTSRQTLSNPTTPRTPLV